MGSITTSAFWTQVAGPSNLTCSACLSLTNTHKHTHRHSFTPRLQYLSPRQMTNCLAASFWPVRGSEITARPPDIKMTQAFTAVVRVQPHTKSIRAHTHTSSRLSEWSRSGWRGKDKGKIENIKRGKWEVDDERSKGRVWVLYWPQRVFLLPHILFSTFHSSLMVDIEGPFQHNRRIPSSLAVINITLSCSY